MRFMRAFSRISLRLMLFNLLLVFLPVAGVLLLDFYEAHLERAQIQSMLREGRMIVGLIQTDPQARFETIAPLLRQQTVISDQRFRIVDTGGHVVLDSGLQRDIEADSSSNPQKNWLYRFGVALLRRPLLWIRPVTRPLPSSDDYERATTLRGKEIQNALIGLRGTEKRVSSAPDRQVTLYAS
ncbi:MAG TPA: hypothetical protein VF980_13745, partial [Thermoanaerobaculia bacterium]